LITLQKFLGTILGVAVGDAVGAFFEGSDPVPEAEVAKKISGAKMLKYTDDTQMTLDLARTLIMRNEFDPARVAAEFVNNYDPSRRYGWSTTKVLQLIRTGTSWEQAAKQIMNGCGSYGNGAAMRVSPLALVYCHDRDRMIESVKTASAITHNHPLGIEGAVIQAEALRLALFASPQNFDPASFVSSVLDVVESDIYREKIETVCRFLDIKASPDEIRNTLGCGSEAFNSVPTALFCFLENPCDFSKCVLKAVSLGGDADTIASMAGALVGALIGKSAIPDAWLSKLENNRGIEHVARSLFFTHIKIVLGNRCEACLSSENLWACKLDPGGPEVIDNYILLCDKCRKESESEERDFFAKPKKHGKYRAVYRRTYRRK
jgi:poly(ADP-ribose) glycohydrolase ARH3